MAPPENSVTNSRADCAFTQQTIGGIKAISPCVKSASAKLFLDLHTVSAPSGEERMLDAAAQVERARWCCRRFDSGTHAWCGHATVMVLVSAARERLHPRSALLSTVPRTALNAYRSYFIYFCGSERLSRRDIWTPVIPVGKEGVRLRAERAEKEGRGQRARGATRRRSASWRRTGAPPP